MRNILLICLLFFSGQQLAHAQQPPLLLDPVKDKREVQGYTIQLRPAPGNTVLFEIFNHGHPMHPVTMLPEGFLTKAEAYKVAEWMIKEYGRQPHPFPPMVCQFVI